MLKNGDKISFVMPIDYNIKDYLGKNKLFIKKFIRIFILKVMIMFSSFFKSKKWALWAYLGLFYCYFSYIYKQA